MPDYNAIYIAAYENDCKKLEELLNADGVDINRTYQQEELLQTWHDTATDTLRTGTLVLAMGCFIIGPDLIKVSIGCTLLGALIATTSPPKQLLCVRHEDDFDSESPRNRDNNGCNALHFAALGGATEAAIILLKHGINTETKDAYGKTWIAIATDKGYKHFIQKCVGHIRDAELAQQIRANNAERKTGIALAQMNEALEELEAKLAEDDEETAAPGLGRR